MADKMADGANEVFVDDELIARLLGGGASQGPTKADPKKSSAVPTEPAKAKLARTEPGTAELATPNPTHANPIQANPTHANPAGPEPVKVDDVRIDDVRVEDISIDRQRIDPAVDSKVPPEKSGPCESAPAPVRPGAFAWYTPSPQTPPRNKVPAAVPGTPAESLAQLTVSLVEGKELGVHEQDADELIKPATSFSHRIPSTLQVQHPVHGEIPATGSVKRTPPGLERATLTGSFARAVSLASQGRLDEAIQVLESTDSARETAPNKVSRAAHTDSPTEAGIGTKPDVPNAHDAAGQALFAQRNFSEAARHFAALARAQPQHPTATYNLGLCLERQGEFAEAARAFQTALAIDPSRWQAELGRGLCLLRLQQPQEALLCLEAAKAARAAAIDGQLNGQVDAQVGNRIEFGRAVALHQLGRFVEAAEIYGALLAEHPESSEALGNLLVVATQRQDWAQVEHWAGKLRQREPDSSLALRGLAAAAAGRGDHQLAIRAGGEIVERLPGSFEDWFHLGVAHHQAGNAEQARQAYEQALRLRPDSAEGQTNLGAILRQQADLPGARQAFHKALEAQPGMLGALWNLALLAESEGNTAETVQLLRQIFAVRPDWEDVAFRLGVLQLQQQEYAAAVISFEAALAQRNPWPDALHNLGLAQWRHGDLASAERSFGRLLGLDSQNVQSSLAALAQICLQRGDAAAALGWYRQVQTPSAELSFNAGLLLQSAGDATNALNCYRAALSANADFAPALINLAHLLKVQGKTQEALQLWSRALAAEPGLAADYFEPR